MNNIEIGQIMNDCLLEGYILKKPAKIKRKGFDVMSLHITTPEGAEYVDEFSFGKSSGGGQELLKVNGEMATRQYLGGSIESEKLDKLGISEDDIIAQLKKFVTKSKGQTRLYSFYEDVEGEWNYSYNILFKNDDPKMTVGLEVIGFSDIFVFHHIIGICPIK